LHYSKYEMGRRARVVLPGQAHHITQRGNQRQNVFLSDSDRRMYLRLLRDHARRAELWILGYCLMTNHVHLVAIPERADSLAKGLGRTHNDYARWLHVGQGQTGHLWQNRFFSCPLDQTHLAEALRYVETNPVRAGLVENVWTWEWSSAPARIGGRDPHNLIHTTAFGGEYGGEDWKRVLEAGWSEAALWKRIREATQTGRPFGTEAFLDAAEREIGHSLRPAKRGPKPKPPHEGAPGNFAFS
jgi:putative transposase